MDKKSTLILLSILHLCILGICVLTIYANKTSKVTVAHVSSDAKVIAPQTEPETEPAPEWHTETETESETPIMPETQIETESETETPIMSETEPASETDPMYTFHFRGTKANLNIRNAPAMSGKIIGKVPVGGKGNVLELTNDDWARIDYQGIVGYCSREWIELQEMK